MRNVFGNPRAQAACLRQSVKDGPSIIRNTAAFGNSSVFSLPSTVYGRTCRPRTEDCRLKRLLQRYAAARVPNFATNASSVGVWIGFDM